MSDESRETADSPVTAAVEIPGWQPEALAELYLELRKTARALRRRNPSDTLNTTAVVHEAWLRHLGQGTSWQDRHHFLAAAALVMRRVLVDHARQRDARKRALGSVEISAAELDDEGRHSVVDMLALDQTLQQLEAIDPRLARLVELRTFGGLTFDEAAAVLGVTSRTAARDWVRARAFLKLHMET